MPKNPAELYLNARLLLALIIPLTKHYNLIKPIEKAYLCVKAHTITAYLNKHNLSPALTNPTYKAALVLQQPGHRLSHRCGNKRGNRLSHRCGNKRGNGLSHRCGNKRGNGLSHSRGNSKAIAFKRTSQLTLNLSKLALSLRYLPLSPKLSALNRRHNTAH